MLGFSRWLAAACCMVLGWLGSLLPSNVLAAQEIWVAFGGVHPPFILSEDRDGLIRDVLDEMNAVQDEFEFKLEIVSPRRAKETYNQIGIDLIAYVSPTWGWRQVGADSYGPLYHDSNWFMARKENASEVLKTWNQQRIIAAAGYSYAFSGYNDDLDAVAEDFEIVAASSERDIVPMLIHRRGDIGVIGLSMFSWVRHTQPEIAAQLVLSETPDHSFDREWILLPGARISKAALAEIMQTMVKSGALGRIYAIYGLSLPPELAAGQ